MSTKKAYYDVDGNEVSLERMVRSESDWAANRIRVGEEAIEELKELKSPWGKSRREELELLLDMIQDLSVADHSSGFLRRVDKCIKTAKKLGHTEFNKPRENFVQFLIRKAAGS